MKTLIISTKIFLVLTLITGVAYPLIVTCIAQVLFPYKTNGSLIKIDNKIVGSELIGQAFDSCIYFMPRPSAINYDASCSGGSNLSMTSAKLQQQVTDRRKAFIEFNQLDSTVQIPSEMLYASGSGLDPHISLEAAMLQVDRIVKARLMNDEQKEKLVSLIYDQADNTSQQYVNVLLLNLQLDNLLKSIENNNQTKS
jgi:potassium-transporting ATPase KdpC subunit